VPQLAHPTSLGDIEDVEAFVNGTLNASGIEFQAWEREDLVAEGLAILYSLFDRFEPHRPGYARPGKFSGFAAMFLPRKLGDSWHRNRPEHRYVTGPDGHREWRFFRAHTSLDEITGDSPRQRGPRGRAGDESGIVDARYWIPVSATPTAAAAQARGTRL
jgi:hypothetical protein